MLERLSHYRVDRLLGVGGMGEVYLAEDARLRRKVALKLLPERFTEDPERVRRFQREAFAASALNHPNIITIYEVGEEEGRHYIATEYVEGETLRDRIASPKPMTVAEVLDISIGICSALAAAHEAGILHRDIKPENIMLRPDGWVKVLDFGLAKLADSGNVMSTSTTGAVMGTLLYISPEQARGLAPDARSDIYALGAVMYEMLTRQPPIVTDSFVELAIAIASMTPPAPSTMADGVPPELDRVVMKALQKDRANRYATARQMLNDLRTLREELEFEQKLTTISTARQGERISSPSLLPTAPLTLHKTETSSVFARIRRRKRGARRAGVAALIVVCALLVGYGIARNTVLAEKPIDSVAVLPFVNASGDPSSEYLSDGIAESIIDSLAQIPQMQVVARSTAFRFKGKDADPLRVGRELNVRAVVTGQLLQRGDTLIIRTSLTDVKKGTQIWGEQYNRKRADVLSVQEEMAEQISSELRMRLSGEQKQLMARRAAVNPEAYQAYLKGRYYLNKYTEESIRKAITYFNQAIEIDPSYAAAYAGISTSYYGLSNVFMAPNEAMPRAREAAQRAVQLDDTLADAHATLALVRVWYDWDFKGGEQEFQRAIDLEPSDAEAHRLYGDFLTAIGRFDRALVEKKRAVDLDPLSVPASWDLGRTLFYAGRFTEAEQQVQRTIDLDEHFPNAYALQAQIAVREGDLAKATAAVQQAIATGGRKPFFVSTLGYISALRGDREQALRCIDELKASQAYTLPLFLARVNAALGNRDEALSWLEKLYAERSESIVWLSVDPTLAPLRDDPRFKALVRRIGLIS